MKRSLPLTALCLLGWELFFCFFTNFERDMAAALSSTENAPIVLRQARQRYLSPKKEGSDDVMLKVYRGRRVEGMNKRNKNNKKRGDDKPGKIFILSRSPSSTPSRAPTVPLTIAPTSTEFSTNTTLQDSVVLPLKEFMISFENVSLHEYDVRIVLEQYLTESMMIKSFDGTDNSTTFAFQESNYNQNYIQLFGSPALMKHNKFRFTGKLYLYGTNPIKTTAKMSATEDSLLEDNQLWEIKQELALFDYSSLIDAFNFHFGPENDIPTIIDKNRSTSSEPYITSMVVSFASNTTINENENSDETNSTATDSNITNPGKVNDYGESQTVQESQNEQNNLTKIILIIIIPMTTCGLMLTAITLVGWSLYNVKVHNNDDVSSVPTKNGNEKEEKNSCVSVDAEQQLDIQPNQKHNNEIAQQTRKGYIGQYATEPTKLDNTSAHAIPATETTFPFFPTIGIMARSHFMTPNTKIIGTNGSTTRSLWNRGNRNVVVLFNPQDDDGNNSVSTDNDILTQNGTSRKGHNRSSRRRNSDRTVRSGNRSSTSSTYSSCGGDDIVTVNDGQTFGQTSRKGGSSCNSSIASIF